MDIDNFCSVHIVISACDTHVIGFKFQSLVVGCWLNQLHLIMGHHGYSAGECLNGCNNLELKLLV